MAFINWSDKFNFNIKIIDSQHKQLVHLINSLHAGMITGRSDEIMARILDELVNYTVTHFSEEEKIFKKINYIDAEAHIIAHAGFVKEIYTFKEQFENNHSIITVKLLIYLKDWLLKHIQGTDLKYRDSFIANGIK